MSTLDEARWLANHDIEQYRTLEVRARVFATAAHAAIDQRRKYTYEPYIEHPAAVVALVKSVPHSIEMVAAAWLHDVVEDTKVTLDDVRREFGDLVAKLVNWLTDVSKSEDGNRAARKAIDRNYLAMGPADAQTIKVADLIDNTKSIAEHDPAFHQVYLAEKAALLDVLTKADSRLRARARKQVDALVGRSTADDLGERT